MLRPMTTMLTVMMMSALMVGCDGDGDGGCSDVVCGVLECSNNLTVKLTGIAELPDADYLMLADDVTESVLGGEQRECGLVIEGGEVTNVEGTDCATYGDAVLFNGFDPGNVRVRLKSATAEFGRVTTERRVATHLPEGPCCDLSCQQAPPVELAVEACDEVPTCTLVGCGTGFTFSFGSPAALASGDYEVTVAGTSFAPNSFGDVRSCEFTVTDGELANNSDCWVRDDTFTMIRFAPTAGTLTLSGPSSVLVNLDIAPTYVDEYPNGPCCQPSCPAMETLIVEVQL